jgi:alkanesulfonate monooxygenase SsuD/methylene tetrahydromethanopterin reductase-like flavin-dependent oxidoreductase (luciferase family)
MKTLAETIVEDILAELGDKAGFDSFWVSIHSDERDKLKAKLIEIVEDHALWL